MNAEATMRTDIDILFVNKCIASVRNVSTLFVVYCLVLYLGLFFRPQFQFIFNSFYHLTFRPKIFNKFRFDARIPNR
jgi:hypothetical protein